MKGFCGKLLACPSLDMYRDNNNYDIHNAIYRNQKFSLFKSV